VKGELVWVEILDSEILCALMMMIIHSYKKTEMVWVENMSPLNNYIHNSLINYCIVCFGIHNSLYNYFF